MPASGPPSSAPSTGPPDPSLDVPDEEPSDAGPSSDGEASSTTPPDEELLVEEELPLNGSTPLEDPVAVPPPVVMACTRVMLASPEVVEGAAPLDPHPGRRPG